MPRGTVLFYNDAGGFGFITDDAAPNNREANVFFASRLMVEHSFEKDDRVEFELGTHRPGKGPTAQSMKLVED
jgi:cold shock CspA family protein